MNLRKKSDSRAVALAHKEIRSKRSEKRIKIFLWALTIIFLLLIILVLFVKFINTGFVSYVESKGGYITEVDMNRTFPTTFWAGIYGLSIRVPGFNEILFNDVSNGIISRQDLFFDCIQSDSPGGPEIYASTSPTIDFDNLNPSTLQGIDDYIGCSGYEECPSNTFKSNMTINVGTREIINIPSTYTFRYDGNKNTFDIGALNDSENLVFVTHIAAMQRGYSHNVTVNFQMLLPVPPNGTQTYYFFNDPYDVCPSGGFGESIEATISGYIFDQEGNILSGAEVVAAGYITSSDPNGHYSVNFTVIPGNYNVIARLTGYDPNITDVSVSFSNYTFERNFTLYRETTGASDTIRPTIFGYVSDELGARIPGVNVTLGGATNLSQSDGFYVITPTITIEPHPIIAVKEGYNNYYYILNFSANTTLLNHNITMTPVVPGYEYEIPPKKYDTGPYTSGPYSSPPGVQMRQIIEETKKTGEDYWISTKEIKREVRQHTFIEDIIGLYNFKTTSMNMVFSLSPELQDFVRLDKTSVSLNPDSYGSLIVTIYGTKPIGTYNGTLFVKGDVEREIPVTIKIVDNRFLVDTLLMDLDLFNRVVMPGDDLRYKLVLNNLLRDQGYRVLVRTSLTDPNGTINYAYNEEEVELLNSLTLLKNIKVPDNVSEGEYSLRIEAEYLNLYSRINSPFVVSYPIYLYSVFGIPLWLMFAIISFLSFMLLNLFVYKSYKERKKRYRIMLDFNTLAKPGERVVRIGNLAETNIPAYYELERLTTHCIVAGATGMGKSISAQVIIEEALLNNIAVIVFDPTAQWSGMLRKCEDKRMISFYSKFGLKDTDARAFKGNVRQILDSRQKVDVRKYMNPGQIQIFSLNKLDPKDIDFFIANVIRQIFKSDPKESPNLKLLIVFDEVHRLLSKFGGSGEGFLQVERACREFRKWGLGVMLISQVLSDFVGEIKANINTEVQTRTLEESDLERIKTKYGEEYLKSLVRAEVGVAMFQNAEYNRGRPYFINFRPILHNTRRLPDEELERYNKYNDIVDELEFQVEQLEKEKVDTFDLKMEIKLVKDKIMTGSFSVVEIYLEGLKPRVAKEWEKLGKQPKKRELELVDEAEVRKAIDEAKKEREKIKSDEAKKQLSEKKEEKPKEENIDLKEVPPITFDNGIMVSSLKELKGILPTLENEIFKLHVNEKKNDIADWFSKNYSKEFGDKIRTILDKKILIKEIEGYGKEKPKEEVKTDAKTDVKTETEKVK